MASRFCLLMAAHYPTLSIESACALNVRDVHRIRIYMKPAAHIRTPEKGIYSIRPASTCRSCLIVQHIYCHLQQEITYVLSCQSITVRNEWSETCKPTFLLIEVSLSIQYAKTAGGLWIRVYKIHRIQRKQQSIRHPWSHVTDSCCRPDDAAASTAHSSSCRRSGCPSSFAPTGPNDKPPLLKPSSLEGILQSSTEV